MIEMVELFPVGVGVATGAVPAEAPFVNIVRQVAGDAGGRRLPELRARPVTACASRLAMAAAQRKIA